LIDHDNVTILDLQQAGHLLVAMKTCLICLIALCACVALCTGQMNMLQSKQVVHLEPHRTMIDISFGGKLLELINAPTLVNLPKVAPKQDSEGNPWSLDVKNLGPSVVTVVTMVGAPQFSINIKVNETVHIYSNGAAYSQKW